MEVKLEVACEGREYSVYYKDGTLIPVSKKCTKCQKIKSHFDAGFPLITEIIDAHTQIPVEKNSSLWEKVEVFAQHQYQCDMRHMDALMYLASVDDCELSEVEETSIKSLMDNGGVPYVCMDCDEDFAEMLMHHI